MIKVVTDYIYTIPTENGGLNKDTAADVNEWAARGYFPIDDKSNPKFDAENAKSIIDVEQWYMNNTQLQTWCAMGQEVEGWLCYHELNDLTKTVPTAYSDLFGDPADTWENWGQASNGSHAPVTFDTTPGLWYRSTLYGEAGTPLLGSAFYDFWRAPNTNQTGIVRLITIDEFAAIQDAANSGP